MATNPESTALTPLLRALVANGLGEEALLRSTAENAARSKKPLIFSLVEHGAVQPAALMAYLSERYGVPMLDLNAVDLDEPVMGLLDRGLMERYQVLPLSRHENVLYLAMADPTDFKAVEDVKFNAGLQVTPVLVEADKLARAVDASAGSMRGRLADLFAEQAATAAEEQEEFDLAKVEEGVEG